MSDKYQESICEDCNLKVEAYHDFKRFTNPYRIYHRSCWKRLRTPVVQPAKMEEVK